VNARGAIARGVLVGWLAVVVAIASRGLVLSVVGRKVDDTVASFAAVASKLPSPRAAPSIDEAPLPPPPPMIASAIASTSPSAAPPKIASTTTIAKSSKKQAPPTLTVTRAEVEDAIATKCHGVKATLVRDDAGAPIGLALHRVGPLARFGVAEGDVLVAANGQSLRTPDEALAALGAMKDATRVSIALRRGDATYVITVQVQVADAP
jgi:hypothetical protein